MSLALKISDAAPTQQQAHPPYKLSANELRLRAQFVAAFMEEFVSTDWSTVEPVREWPDSR